MSEYVGKTALFYNQEQVPYTKRVMVTKALDNGNYIVSEFDNPYKFYETGTFHFTIEKDEDQPEENLLQTYVEAYENAGAA